MPRKPLMTWEGEPNYRWKKMFNGKVFTVTCKQLNAPRTMVGSYQLANKWWTNQFKKINNKKQIINSNNTINLKTIEYLLNLLIRDKNNKKFDF